ncbi:MAG: UDP-N-acetylmuramoyl-L-alanyl-D-glutamate--2,6-diaminopimelate ligase, partial [Candidatus Omnitrophica bacterium]|nr:UDP-N-acetylmuramoyl-L-alanyl-D-glutamate--2,6-diaminopimelate ligase [Candidatus Omnitrophota bacterium]
MKLRRILKDLDGLKDIEGKTSLEIKGLACDSKAVRDGFLFAAVRGSRFNGADFIDEAIQRGAVAIILESGNKKAHTFKRGSTFIYTDDVRRALSQSSMAFYGDISAKMRLIGVTGTNGKTTTTYLLERLFNKIGEDTGVIGTINYRFGDRLIPAVNTTPGVLELCSLLSSMRKQGIKNSIIEVSSHSLEQGRVDTLSFDIAVFTNLTSEHLDFHKDMKGYLSSKMKLFSKIKQGGYAVINRDDTSSEDIIKRVSSEKKARVLT